MTAAHINHAKIANVCKVVVFLQLRGGKEVEADGKTVVLKSRETIESVKFAVSLWKEACDEGGLAWDDTSNNRAQHQRHKQRRGDLHRSQAQA